MIIVKKTQGPSKFRKFNMKDRSIANGILSRSWQSTAIYPANKARCSLPGGTTCKINCSSLWTDENSCTFLLKTWFHQHPKCKLNEWREQIDLKWGGNCGVDSSSNKGPTQAIAQCICRVEWSEDINSAHSCTFQSPFHYSLDLLQRKAAEAGSQTYAWNASRNRYVQRQNHCRSWQMGICWGKCLRDYNIDNGPYSRLTGAVPSRQCRQVGLERLHFDYHLPLEGYGIILQH